MTPAFREVEALLRKAIGLNAEAVSPQALDSLIRMRMKAIGEPDMDRYASRLHADPSEFEEMIESAVVFETWFFRDHEPFEYLQRFVIRDWLPERATGPLRILSLPCSTGEESYSIAIALRDAGLPASRIRIDAVDVSRRALAVAAEGSYTRNSFREKARPEDRRFFAERDGRQVVDPSLRQGIRFRHAEALQFCAGLAEDSYDVIFCRNLLIYLCEEHRRNLVAGLDRALAPGGVFFLGHAEMPHVFLPHYTAAPHPRAFAAVKRGAAAVERRTFAR